MGFKFGKGDRVDTANGKSGKVFLREDASVRGGRQNRYVVDEDPYHGGGQNVYFEEELRRER